MQRNNQTEVENDSSSTKKIYTEFSIGGPPAKPPIFGPKFKVYDGSEEIKIDKSGESYTGLSLEELNQILTNQEGEPNTSPNETPSKNDNSNQTGVLYNLKK